MNKLINGTGIHLKNVVVLGFFVLLLDALYISIFGSAFTKMIEEIQNSKFKINILGAIFTYILIILGIYYFIILKKMSMMDAFLLGFFSYGIYDLTSLSLFKTWKPQLVIIDTVWGGILFMTSTYLYSLIVR
jgi:uncharacterized membrane protein|tara:strand:+ start:342 stop:737 length:396 start_codon:yes stop_codon:yes gene_type:complete